MGTGESREFEKVEKFEKIKKARKPPISFFSGVVSSHESGKPTSSITRGFVYTKRVVTVCTAAATA